MNPAPSRSATNHRALPSPFSFRFSFPALLLHPDHDPQWPLPVPHPLQQRFGFRPTCPNICFVPDYHTISLPSGPQTRASLALPPEGCPRSVVPLPEKSPPSSGRTLPAFHAPSAGLHGRARCARCPRTGDGALGTLRTQSSTICQSPFGHSLSNAMAGPRPSGGT